MLSKNPVTANNWVFYYQLVQIQGNSINEKTKSQAIHLDYQTNERITQP